MLNVLLICIALRAITTLKNVCVIIGAHYRVHYSHAASGCQLVLMTPSHEVMASPGEGLVRQQF
jgi:hypothetical protein